MSCRKLLTVVVALMCACVGVRAQGPVDATVTVTNVFEPRQDMAVFELTIERESLRWDLWANGTFRLQAVGSDGLVIPIDASVFDFRYVAGSSSLPTAGYNPNTMQMYHISTRLANGLATIAIIGPDSAGSAFRILAQQQPLILGRFELVTKDGSNVPKDITFEALEPRLQANAFKLDHDSITTQGSERYTWYSRHDNVEMLTTYKGKQTTQPCDTLVVSDFYGRYKGDLQVEFGFKSQCELGTQGYIIERSLIRNGDTTNLQFEARSGLGYTDNTQMLACSVCVGPREYSQITDNVEYRRTLYAYRLRSIALRTGVVTDHDTVFVRIPNAIISNAFIRENPFRTTTSVSFNCDDRLILTAAVYDVGGRLISYLLDPTGQPIQNREYQIGTGYTGVFNAPEVSSQGLYDIVLIATPLNDKTIEDLSRVVIKAQLLR